jgi:hypothetical protein
MGPFNANGAPLVGSLSIAQLRLNGNSYENLDTHYFDREEDGTKWVWGCRPPGGEIGNRAKAQSLSDLLINFLEVTDLGECIAIVIKTSNNDADKSGSICRSDVLKLIASCVMETKILNVVVDGESHVAPRFIRWGPVRGNNDEQMPAIYIPLIPADLFVESSEPLINNVAMTDWHEVPDHWHLWETLYKSGDNYMLFQSEFGYEDQVFYAVSSEGIPNEILQHARSFDIPSEGPDRHPIDRWGKLLVFDRGRELLP